MTADDAHRRALDLGFFRLAELSGDDRTALLWALLRDSGPGRSLTPDEVENCLGNVEEYGWPGDPRDSDEDLPDDE